MLLREDGSDLYLEPVRYGDDGAPVSGYVVNGAWTWEVIDGEEVAKDGYGRVVNRWPRTNYTVVPVAEGGHYEDVIRRAREQAAAGR